MILELTPEQLWQLVEGDAIKVDGVHVRRGAGRVIDGTPVEERPNVREARLDARQRVTGEPRFWMRAKYDGKCAGSDGHRIFKGANVLRDADAKKTYCAACGTRLFPELNAPAPA